MKTIRFLATTGILASGIIQFPNSAQASVIIDDRFDSNTLWVTPPGWTNYISSSLVSNAQSTSPNNSLYIPATGVREVGRALSSAVLLASDDAHRVSMDVYGTGSSAGSTLFRIILNNGGAGSLGSVWFSNNTLYARSGSGASGNVSIGNGEFLANQWYTVIFSFTPSDGYMTISVEQSGNKIGDDKVVSFDLGNNPGLDASPSFSQILLSTGYSTGSSAYFYVDNVKLEAIPEPNAIALTSFVGLSLLGLRRFRQGKLGLKDDERKAGQ